MKKLLIILSLFLFSCGSFEKYKESKSKKDKTETETAKGNETKTATFKDFFSFEPYDNTKPMIFGRDTIVNTKIINNKETIYNHSKDTVFVKEKKNVETDESVKHKESDNTKLFAIIGIALIFGLFFFFLIVIFGLVWYFNSKISKLV